MSRSCASLQAAPSIGARADATAQVDVTYELRNFDRWYAAARGPFGKNGRGTSLFEETIEIGTDRDGAPLLIGRYIAGRDYKMGSWARPKPMWSWDDAWDDIPVLIWHFFPSRAFASHFGGDLSHGYLYNAPAEKTFAMSADELWERLDLEVGKKRNRAKKWSKLRKPGNNATIATYTRAASYWIKRYVNYLFNALG